MRKICIILQGKTGNRSFFSPEGLHLLPQALYTALDRLGLSTAPAGKGLVHSLSQRTHIGAAGDEAVAVVGIKATVVLKDREPLTHFSLFISQLGQLPEAWRSKAFCQFLHEGARSKR